MRVIGKAVPTGFAILLGVFCLALATPTHAQTLKLGDRVRVTAPILGRPIIGRLAQADDSLLTIVTSEPTRMAPAEQLTIDRETVTRIEQSSGLNAKTGKYALVGALLGVAAGVTLGYLAAMGAESPGPLYTLPIVYGVGGTILGAAVGNASSGERWTEVAPDARIGLQIGAPALPLAVGVRASF